MRPARTTFFGYVEALLLAVVLATFVKTYVVQPFKIPTPSMEENLLVGDHILVNKFIYGSTATRLEPELLPQRQVRRGDVVVFKFPRQPDRDFIKRCVGLPGDTIELRDKVLYVNDTLMDETGYVLYRDSRTYPSSLFLPDDYRLRDNFGPYRVPSDHLFFLGDNRDNSHDSRFWGAVPLEHVKGRALAVYWSFESDEDHSTWPGYVGRLRQFGDVARRFLSHTRWERTLRLVR